jgi:hypothetical protein
LRTEQETKADQYDVWDTSTTSTYPIQFLSGLVFQAPNILHGHSVPPVYPTENLPAFHTDKCNQSIDSHQQKVIAREKNNPPMEIGEESTFSFHDKALDTRLKAKPFEFGGN